MVLALTRLSAFEFNQSGVTVDCFMTYLEKLRDPRWLEFSRAVKARASWHCERCGKKSNNLQSHHKLYRSGVDPWDYEMREMECLCDQCHKKVTRLMKRMQWAFCDLTIEQMAKALFILITHKELNGVEMTRADKAEFIKSWTTQA